MNYLVDIGLEVHVELATLSKMFCACPVVDPTTSMPNSAVCPVCCGMPGVLPVINQKAVELAIKAGLALNCTIASTSIFARKNYFYPDLPKGYQISQYELPLATNGYIQINNQGGERNIRIRRAHLEEDTGKLTHINKNGEAYSLVDLNRAGVPLLEIVSEPDMHSVDDVRSYSHELRLLLRWLGVSKGNMEKGNMRFEANLSMRPEGVDTLGTRVEIKNLNSFKAMEQAIFYQIKIQENTLASGGKVLQQTLGWNEAMGKTITQRSKEDADDYRYFSEPDLPPLIIEKEWFESIKANLPETLKQIRKRYIAEFELHSEDIERLFEEKEKIQFFEECLASAPNLSPKVIANWMLTDLFSWINQHRTQLSEIRISPNQFCKLVNQVEEGIINQNTGKEILAEMLDNGKDSSEIIGVRELRQISNNEMIAEMVSIVLHENTQEVISYQEGKENLVNWFFGQVMRKAHGKANPQLVKKELHRQLKTIKFIKSNKN